jgi:hypothetical protein
MSHSRVSGWAQQESTPAFHPPEPDASLSQLHAGTSNASVVPNVVTPTLDRDLITNTTAQAIIERIQNSKENQGFIMGNQWYPHPRPGSSSIGLEDIRAIVENIWRSAHEINASAAARTSHVSDKDLRTIELRDLAEQY